MEELKLELQNYIAEKIKICQDIFIVIGIEMRKNSNEYMLFSVSTNDDKEFKRIPKIKQTTKNNMYLFFYQKINNNYQLIKKL